MRRPNWVFHIALSLSVLPLSAEAQLAAPADANAPAPAPSNPIGGVVSIDFVTLKGTSPGAPLRFGNVIPNTETVSFGGRTLRRGDDYAMDYPAGVVYLKVAAKPGDTLSVSYRYDNKPDPNAAARASSLSTFRYTLVPGGLNMLMGLGMTERANDGSVMSSNVFGFSNDSKLGGLRTKGVFLYGQRERNDVQGGLQMDRSGKAGDAGTEQGDSQLILQQVGGRVMGGDVQVDYQDVSKNFSAFNQLKASGAEDATINQIGRERGLTRLGFSAKDLKVGGGFGFSSSFRNVKDEKGAIEWRSYGFQGNGLSVNFTGQRVDQEFARFKDIAEGDREQLMRERGLSRENLSAAFQQKVGKISFTSNSITDDGSDRSIKRQEVALDTRAVKFNLGEQEVSDGFSRFDSLLGEERGRWGREAGMSRQWFGLQTSLFGTGAPIAFNQSSFKDANGRFTTQDATVNAKTFSLQHVVRRADAGFGGLGRMQDGEMDGHIRTIANMLDRNIQTRGEDRWGFTQGAGLSREFNSFSTQPFKNWSAEISEFKFRGKEDGGALLSANLQTPGLKANFRRQNIGANFREVSNLMEFERQRLGNVAGMERTDLGLSMNLGRGRSFSFEKTDALLADKGLARQKFAYNDKRLEVRVNTREIDPGMQTSQLVDPERDFLNAIVGTKQRDITAKWQLMPNLRAEILDYTSKSMATLEERFLRDVNLSWNPTGKTALNYQRTESETRDPWKTLFSNVTERMRVSQDLGRIGRFSFLNETFTYSGEQNTTPDATRQVFAFETKIDKITSVRTEQTRTSFEDGNKENISANTVSRDLSKRSGVSVTDISVDRKGTDRDEKRRNYGFWWDLGNGLRLNYGYARHLNGETAGTLNSTVSLGTNTIGQADQTNQIQQAEVRGLRMGGAYGVNQWDENGRTQSFSNVGLSTARPIRLGAFRDLTFGFSFDSAADYTNWLRENKFGSISGSLWGNKFGYEYRSQMVPTGDRGIDRIFRFETASGPKNWLTGSLYYKARTLPNDQQVMVRDLGLTARLNPQFSLTTKLRTNPEVFRGDVLLGSITQADRSNEWSLDWKHSRNLTVSGSWRELINDQTKALSRNAGLTFKFNEAKGSPLTFYYGLEQADGNVQRRTAHRYHIQFDQRPGPNQVFSVFAGSVSYEGLSQNGSLNANFVLRLDYQIRF